MEKKIRKKLANAIKDNNFDEILNWRVRLYEDYKSAGREDDSIEELKDMLDDLSADKNKIRLGQANRQLGEALLMTTSYKDAAKYFQKYLSLAKADGCEIEQQRAHASLGRMYLMEAQCADTEIEKKEAIGFAYRHNLKGITYANKLVDSKKIDLKEAATMKSRLKINIALSFELEGRNKDAENHAEAALKLVRESNCAPYDVIKCLQILASITSKAGSSSEGLVLICEALKLAEGISGDGSNEVLCEVLEAKADLHFIVGDFDLAKRCLCKAYLLDLKQGREQLATQLKRVVFVLVTLEKLRQIEESEYLQRKKIFEQLGDCVVALKSFSKAVDYYKKMFEYCELLGDGEKNKSAALVSIAESYADMWMFHDALKYYEMEKDLWAHEPKEEFRSRLNLASIYERKGDPENQLEQLNHARSLAQQAAIPSLMIDVLLQLQNYYKANTEKSENPQEILSNLEDEISELRRQGNSQSEGGSQSEVGSQPMDTDEETYEKIDLSSLPELQNDEANEGRSRPKRNMPVTKNEKGETKLHLACIKGNLKAVQMLIKNGHPVTVYDQAGWAPIHEAANYGHVDIIQFLLDRGANVNEQGKLSSMECQGVTPLIDSSFNGHLTVIELLLDRGAKVELKTTKLPKHNALTALDEWFKKEKDDLADNKLERYQNIRKRMIELLKKAGERVDSLSSTYRPEFVVGSDDESQRTVQNRRLQEIRRLATQTSDSDSDHGQLRRIKQTQKLLYSEDDDPQATRRRSSMASDNDHEAGPSTSTGRQTGSPSSVSEYRNAMDNVKRRNAPTQPSAPRRYTENVSALVSEEQANEEWLEEDLRPNASKRRRSPDLNRPESASRVKRTKRRSRLSSGSSRSSSPEVLASDRQPSPELVRVVTPPSRPVNNESDYDSSDGVISFYPDLPLRRPSPVKKSPQKRQRILASPRRASPKKALEENICIRVKVDGKTLLVPINSRTLTFGALAEKVAERYLKMEGMEPKLTLTTADGAFLSTEDSVGMVLQPNEFSVELCAIIDLLKLPPLSKRYKEACKVENIGLIFPDAEEDKYILNCLEESQATMEIALKNLPLGSQFSLVVKSIQKEASLQTLDFSGCSLEDDGLKLLSGVLKNLENLERLELSCNYITSAGLHELSEKVGNEKSLLSLRHLNLSHNCFGADGLKVVSELLLNLSLTSLNLSNCELSFPETSSTIVPTLYMENLEDLNVSYNSLGYRGVSHLFVGLNGWKLKSLNLAYTTLDSEDVDDPNSVAKEVALLFQKIVVKDDRGGVLQEMNFAGCNLKDVDIWDMLSAASDCGVKIEHLKISCNPELSSLSLKSLVNHTPALLKLTATGCPKLYNESVKLVENFQELSLTTLDNIPVSEKKNLLRGTAGYVMIKSSS